MDNLSEKIENEKESNNSKTLYLNKFDMFDLDTKSFDNRYRLASGYCDIEINENVKKLIDFIKANQGNDFNSIKNDYLAQYKTDENIFDKTIETLLEKKIITFQKEDESAEEYHRNKLRNLWLRFKLIDTDKYSKFFEYFAFTFSKSFVLTTLAAFALLDIIFWTAYNSDTWSEKLYYFSSYDYLVVMGLASFVLFFHELGHIVAAKKYSSKTGGIGVGIYFYMPVAYADVHETWNLKISQRMVVSIGGAYWGILATIPLLIITLLFNLKALADFIIAFHFSFIFLFNPFLKMDGYWFLCDLLGIPNLRNKVKMFLKEWFWPKVFRKKEVNNIFAPYPKKIKIAVIFYLIISTTFMTLFMAFILYKGASIIINYDTQLLGIINNLVNNVKFADNINRLFRNVIIIIASLRISWNYLKLLFAKIKQFVEYVTKVFAMKSKAVS